MLRRYATVGFAMLGLLMFDWEDPSNEALSCSMLSMELLKSWTLWRQMEPARSGTPWIAKQCNWPNSGPAHPACRA